MKEDFFEIAFLDHGRTASQPADPRFPDGIDVVVARPDQFFCKVMLPYPAPRCGVWRIACHQCGYVGACTAAGRRDDPRSMSLPCKGLEKPE